MVKLAPGASMSEYITAQFEDKGKFQVLSENDKSFSIVFDDKSEAHKFSVSLMLGAAPSPDQSPSFYELIKEDAGQKIYKVAKQSQVTQENSFDISECCQSGCTGCPYFS